MFRNNILIASHRRSGTHLTIDLIRNNFGALNIVVLEQVVMGDDPKGLALLKSDVPCIVKTHYFAETSSLLLAGDALGQEELKELFSSSMVFYALRNVYDVLVSLWHYRKSYGAVVNENFSEYIREDMNPSMEQNNGVSRAAYWAYHVSSWINRPNVQVMSFEHIILHYEKSVEKIAARLGVAMPEEIIDIRRGGAKVDPRANFTSVAFRKGKVGGSESYYSPEDVEFVQNEAGNVLEQVAKYLS